MKRTLPLLLSVSLLALPVHAQSLGDLLGGIFGTPTSPEEAAEIRPTSTPNNAGISAFDADAGLRQALTLGTQAVSQQLSRQDGYFGDATIRIPLPGRLGDLQDQLSRFGAAGPLDDLQLHMNRAAEAAAPEAADLVIDAVRSLSIDDALSLLNGGDTAATSLLRTKTEQNLSSRLKPHVQSALQDSGALDMTDSVLSQYGMGDIASEFRQDMVDHAVTGALDGLFFYLAEEERDIRNNPVERSTDLLRHVFGG